ncbi:MAG: flavoprotein, partial [Candidatus Aenigmatarchaeota archaeon]
EHIALADWAELVVIAPATANTISKIASGISDNLLTTVICSLSKETPVLIVPAMNENMWKNRIIQENVLKLKKLKKYIILEPEKGELACGKIAEGRLPNPTKIYEKISSIINKIYK